MRTAPVSHWLKLFSLAGSVAGLFVAWILSPVFGLVGPGVWRFTGVLGAAMVGIIGGHVVGSSRGTVGALGVGLLAGVVSAELLTPSDVSRSVADYVETVGFLKLELVSMIAAGAVGASVARWLALRRSPI